MASPSPTDGSALRAKFVDFAAPHKVLTNSEACVARRLCLLLKRNLFSIAAAAVRAANHRPVLYTYQADGTPALSMTTVVRQVTQERRVVRRAGAAMEFLVERGYIKSISAGGCVSVAALMREPRPMSSGKGSWCIYASAAAFWPGVRSFGHQGPAIAHFAFDRAVHSAVVRKLRQRQAQMYASCDTDASASISWLLDWIIDTGCSAHDIHNGLRWSLEFLVTLPNMLKDYHIVLQSLRQSYDLILRFMRPCLEKHLRFRSVRSDPHEAYNFWLCLAVESDVCELLVDLDVWVDGDAIFVHESHKTSPALIETLTSCLLYIFKWKQYTDSRWLTIGSSSRSLCASAAAGIHLLVNMIMGDDSVSKYFIGGFARLSSEVLHYAVVASVSAWPCDALMTEVFTDDRLLRRGADLRALFIEEVQWIQDLSWSVWQRFGRIADRRPEALRHDCLRAANLAGAYIDRKVWAHMRRLPLSLAVGDVCHNLQLLEAMSHDPHDEVSCKLRQLMRIGYNRSILEDSLRLIAEIHWTTNGAEQGHGSMSVVHKCHRQYGSAMLAERSLLTAARPLFNVSEEDRRDARKRRRLDTLRRRKPERMTGRHMFLGDLVRAAQAASGRRLRRDEMNSLMRQHGQRYQALPQMRRLEYERIAKQRANKDRELVDSEVCHALADMALHRQRSRAAFEDEGVQSRLASCRFDDERMSAMALAFDCGDFSAVCEVRDGAIGPPIAPSAAEQASLGEFIVEEPSQEFCPDWCKRICRHRDNFSNCIVIVEHDQVYEYYYFNFAVLRPMVASFSPVREISVSEPSMPAMATVGEKTALLIRCSLSTSRSSGATSFWDMKSAPKPVPASGSCRMWCAATPTAFGAIATS